MKYFFGGGGDPESRSDMKQSTHYESTLQIYLLDFSVSSLRYPADAPTTS